MFDSFWVSFYVWYGVRVISTGCPIFPAPFVGKTVLSLWNSLGILIKNQLTINIQVYFWTLDSILFICMSIHVPVPHCLSYYYFIASFEIGKCESSYFILFQDCFGYSRSLAIPYKFENQPVSWYELRGSHRDLCWICTSVWGLLQS